MRGPVAAEVDQPTAMLCVLRPTRVEFAALSRLGAPVLFPTAAQLPYVQSLARPLTPLRLPTPADRAQDRAADLRERVAQILTDRSVDAELALLDPLFERHDPAEVAAALLAILGGGGRGRASQPIVPAPPACVPLFLN